MSPSKLSPASDPRLASSGARGGDLADAWPLLEQLPGAVLVLDAAGSVLQLNDRAEHTLGRARAELMGRDLFREVLPALEGEGVGARYRAAMQQEAASLEWEAYVPAADREPLPVLMSMRSCHRRDAHWGLLLVEDRTAVAREVERRRQAERLAAVGELATGVAHEINNPLASIKSFAQLLARDAATPDQLQALEIISGECSRIANVINNLLDFSQQQRVHVVERLNLSALADGVVALKEYALQTAGVSIERELDPGLSPVSVECGAVQRAVLALLTHAERALQEREGERRLIVRTCESSEGVALYVIDNGPGIPRDRLRSLFEGSADDGNLGLTLLGAATAIREQGGQLWADSAPGRGTSFCVRFPCAEPEAASAPDTADADPAAPHAGKRLRVLVADDEATLRLALSLYLGRHGHEVHQAADVQEALTLVQQHHYDVALVDVRMPGDGLSLLRELDRIPELAGRTVLMTGDTAAARLRDERMVDRACLSKPFDMEEVLRLVESLAG